MATIRALGFLATLVLGAVVGASCGPPPGASCRFDPFCGQGDFGAFCEGGHQCKQAFCCETDECNEGMCSVPCKNDKDCPYGLECHGKVCYFSCGSEADCAEGQRCAGFCRWD
jgi:hypothetical protein